MKPEHVVTIIGVAAAVAVVALFLIAIVVELRRTHLQLVVILGAVAETVNQTDGLESVVSDIATDIAAGQAALLACVERLEQRLGSEGNGVPPSAPHSYTNY
ncbi:MAG TPA: hypothetical protein VL120_05815 [Solirubrobacteraceae bacterium]|jgi:hypothetical protein|nr:hypothetical protein [Solirubrobacteraceae bacterium]